MATDIEGARTTFVEALTELLCADRDGLATPEHRAKLAKARAQAEKVLDPKQYGEAVFEAFRRSGRDWG